MSKNTFAIFIVCMTLALPAFAHAVGPDAPGAPAPVRVAQKAISIADIMTDPKAFVGKTVTVTSEVEEVYSPFAFRLDEQKLAAGGIDNDLLVIGTKGSTAWAFDDQWLNDSVQVTGTVRLFKLEEIEREFGYDLDEARFKDWTNKPVLVASSIERVK
jgi:hypothetical protein